MQGTALVMSRHAILTNFCYRGAEHHHCSLQAQQVLRVGTNEIGSPWSFRETASNSERKERQRSISLPRSAKTPRV